VAVFLAAQVAIGVGIGCGKHMGHAGMALRLLAVEAAVAVGIQLGPAQALAGGGGVRRLLLDRAGGRRLAALCVGMLLFFGCGLGHGQRRNRCQAQDERAGKQTWVIHWRLLLGWMWVAWTRLAIHAPTTCPAAHESCLGNDRR